MELMDLLVYGGILVAIVGRGIAMNNRKKKRQQEYLDRQNQQGQPSGGPAPGMPTNKESSKMAELRERLERLNEEQTFTLEQQRQMQLQKQYAEQQKRQALFQKQQMEQQKQQALLAQQQAQQQRMPVQPQQQRVQVRPQVQPQVRPQVQQRNQMLANADAKVHEVVTSGNLGLESRRELVRGIVLSEILGKPRALRKGRL